MIPLRLQAFFCEATGSNGRWRLVFWLCLGLLCSALASAASLELAGEQGDGYRPVFQYTVDADRDKSLGQVRQLPESAFRSSGPHGIALGFIKSAVWLRFEVRNRSGPETAWLLQFTD